MTATTALADAADRIRSAHDDLLRAVLDARDTSHINQLMLRDHLVLDLRLPDALAARVERVADRLECLPHVAALYDTGRLTFDELSVVVSATSRLSGHPLAVADERIADNIVLLTDEGRLHDLDTVACSIADQLRAPGWAIRQERRAEDGRSVSLQQDFDGGGLLLADLDAVGFTTVASAIEHAANTLGDLTTDTKRQLRADALIAICGDSLSSTAGPGKAARPTLTVIVDLEQLTTDRVGMLLRSVSARGLPTLSARLTDALATNADLLVQIADGARPLLELQHHEDLPDKLRRTVIARDRGCRFPRCNRRATHIHHITWRSDGGTHDPDNLILLCPMHHLRAVHRQGWRPTLDPTSGTVTWHRRGHPPLTTRPHGTDPPPRSRLRPPMPPMPPPPDEPPPPDPLIRAA